MGKVEAAPDSIFSKWARLKADNAGASTPTAPFGAIGGDEWRVEDMYDVLANPPPRPEELIKGVCFVGSKISMSGPSKSMKTFWQMHLAFCIAHGIPWFGHLTRKGRVLYINFELGVWSFQDRLRHIAERIGVSLDRGAFSVLHLRGKKVSIELLESKLAELLDGQHFALICFDPLYKILGNRKENDSSDMADLLGRLERIAHDANAAYVVAHHFAKGNAANKESMDRGSGSGVVSRDGDCLVSLTPHDEDGCMSMETTVRDLPPVPDVVLRWRYPVFEADGTLNPAHLKRPGPALDDVTVEDVLAATTDTFQTRDAIQDAVAKRTGRGAKAVQSAFRAALDAGVFKTESLKRPGTNPLIRYASNATRYTYTDPDDSGKQTQAGGA